MFQGLAKYRMYLKILVVPTLLLMLAGFKGCDWLCKKTNCTSSVCSSPCSEKELGANSNINCYTINSKETKDSSPIVASFEQGVEAKICFNVSLPKELSKDSVEASLQAMVGQKINLDQMPQQRDIIIADVMKTKSMLIDNLEDLLKNDSEFADKLSSIFLTQLEVMVFQRIAEKLEKEIVVSKSEVAAEFEANKNRYVEQMGGTKVVTAKFNDQEMAETFYNNYNGMNGRISEEAFLKDAKSFGAEIKELGWLSKEFPRGASAQIIKLLETRKHLPMIELITNNDESMVIMLSEKRDTIYSDPSKNPRIEEMLKRKKLMDKLNKLTEDTNKKVGATVISLPKSENVTSKNPSSEEDMDEEGFDQEDENFSDIDELVKSDTDLENAIESLV